MGKSEKKKSKTIKSNTSRANISTADTTRKMRKSFNLMNKYFLGNPISKNIKFQISSNKLKTNSEIISSFAGAFIRNWIRKQQEQNLNYFFYELSYMNDKLIIKDVNGKDTKMSFSSKNYMIIKVKSPAPPHHYPNHWYFKTPTSQEDNSDNLSPTGWKHKKKLPYTNSYTLDWQLVSTNQFCMIYALYGTIVPLNEQTLVHVENRNNIKDDRIKIIFETDEEKRKNLYEGIDFTNQNKNTSTILTFFLNLIKTYIYSDPDLIMKSVKDGSDAYKKKHNKSYTLKDVIDQIQDGIKFPEHHKPEW